MIRWAAAGTLAVSCLLFIGCSDPYEGRQAVSGKITLKGQPLKDGTIFFVPLDGQGSQANTPFKDGVYKIERAEGLLPGKYLIRISSADKGGAGIVDEAEAGGPGGSRNITFFDIIPPDWNVASKQEVTVKAGEKNEFSFDIPTQLEPKRRKR
jgi:hypothetical protein